jgi:CBS domain containing-hemolysin-like protein
LEIFLLILVTQEFLPRVIFQKHADFWVKVLAVPSFIFYILFFPLNRILISFSRFLLSLFGVKTKPFEDQSFEKEDLDSFVKMSMDEMPEENQSDPDVKIFRNALDFSTKSVKDCMVPRADIVAVSNDIGLEALKEKFIETGLSRILVYEDNIDNIIGYIHMWEMLNNPSDWTKRITPLSFVPESMSAKKLMSELMQEHRNMAVVVDEFGGTSGIVTLEDLVEEIFGEIEDEYDTKSRFAKREKDNEYVLSGRMEIDQVNEMFDLDLPESDDYTTVAGLVLHYTQRFPKTYETVEIGKFTFKILKVTARKIEVVRLIVNDNNKN